MNAKVKNVLNENESSEKIWAVLLHLSFNFAGGIARWGGIRKEFEPDLSLWDAAIHKMAESGVNMVVINLDDSIQWQSHPEIALKNAWTPQRLREELAKIRSLGIEPIPMLNFSSTHDAWLGKYSKMVSTKAYYAVCSDLINEAIDIFGAPRFFHFGMDEETIAHQKQFDYIIMRQKELWWGDLYFYIGEAFKRRVRPWVWSDYIWHHPEMFLKMMPKSVIQSNWYYGEEFGLSDDNPARMRVQAYLDLESNGYDQVPTASNDGVVYGKSNVKSIGNTVDFCVKHIDDKHLMGFMQTLWVPTIQQYRGNIMQGIELIGTARKQYEKNQQ